jgi:hypothetical protein
MAETQSILDSSSLWSSTGAWIGLNPAQVAMLKPGAEAECYADCERASVALAESEATAKAAEQTLFAAVRALREAQHALSTCASRPTHLSLVRAMSASR